MSIPTFSRLDGAVVDFTHVKDPAVFERIISYFGRDSAASRYIGREIGKINDGYYSKFISPNDKHILDIGSGIGALSIYVSSQATTVLSIEPSDDEYQLLAALSMDFAGKKCGHSFLHSIVGKGNADILPHIISLGSILRYYMDNNATIDFMRLNTRAVERDALPNTRLAVLRKVCKTILVELGENNESNDAYFEYFACLSRAGYDVVKVDNSTMLAR